MADEQKISSDDILDARFFLNPNHLKCLYDDNGRWIGTETIVQKSKNASEVREISLKKHPYRNLIIEYINAEILKISNDGFFSVRSANFLFFKTFALKDESGEIKLKGDDVQSNLVKFAYDALFPELKRFYETRGYTVVEHSKYDFEISW